MAVEFEHAGAVEIIARELIEQHHSHLVNAQIAYLFRVSDSDWESKGKIILGKAYKVPAREKHFSEADFAIVINERMWRILSEAQRRALVDHELCHCGTNGEDDDGNPRWCIWGHDVEEFRAIIDRHGLWETDVRKFAEASAKHVTQQTLFDLAKVEEKSEPEPAEVVN